MNKIFKIIFVIISVFSLAMFLSRNKDKSADLPLDESVDIRVDEVNYQEKIETFEENINIFELSKREGSFKCEFSQEVQYSSSNGFVYISNNKIKGEFFSIVSLPEYGIENEIISYMISDGESVYTWTSMSDEGYKASINESSTLNNQENFQMNYIDEKLNYKCEPYNVDQSKFLLPTNITFKNI